MRIYSLLWTPKLVTVFENYDRDIPGIFFHNVYVVCCVIFYLLYILQHSPHLSVSDKLV